MSKHPTNNVYRPSFRRTQPESSTYKILMIEILNNCSAGSRIKPACPVGRSGMTSGFGMATLTLLIMMATFFVATSFAAMPPQLLLTWRAGSYVEPTYAGKILPGLNTPITLAVQLIDDGKIIDLTKKEIRWFMNNKLLQSGIGQTSVTVQTDALGLYGNSLAVKVVALQYKAVDVRRLLDIPVAAPEIVIRAPALTITSGKHALQAFLYHWGVTDPHTLRLTWNANGQQTTNNGADRAIELQVPVVTTPTPIRITLDVKNPSNEYEFANNEINLIVQ